MENHFSQKRYVSSSIVDMNGNFRFDGVLGVFQDTATAHSAQMGVDHDRLVVSSNAFWVLSKVKFRIDGVFKTDDEIVADTWPLKPSAYRFIREHKITKDGGTVDGRSEWCVLDCEKLTVRKSSSIDYPHDMDCLEERASVSDFLRLNVAEEDCNYCYDYTTRLTDVDCNGHVNNLAYARMALNVFSPEEYPVYGFNAFEIHFVSQTYHGDTVKVYVKKDVDTVYVEGRMDDKTVFKALFYKE